VLVEQATVRAAEKLIESCEHCNPESAEIPFDNVLDRVTGSDPSVTDYVLESAAKCPNCRREILEETLVEPALSYPHLVYTQCLIGPVDSPLYSCWLGAECERINDVSFPNVNLQKIVKKSIVPIWQL
jgi:hypothetical protein